MWTYQHINFLVHQIPALRDNYIYIIEHCHSDIVIVVDPCLAQPVVKACEQLQLQPTHIFNTHHHWDHTDGNQELVQIYGCQIVANRADSERIAGISLPLTADEPLLLGSMQFDVFDVPGHTLGHIAFVIDDALFCGDTIFGGGCGRLFEGSFAQMWHSLQKLSALDGNTKVYCAHEYTLPNLRFAREIDAANDILKQRILEDTRSRRNKLPTVPSSLELELKTNPFLRPLDPTFCTAYNPELNSLEIFKAIRQKKDDW